MTPKQPPRLPLALLHRFLGDNEPLVGDLIEEFQARRSRLWFWRQAIMAVLIHAGIPRDDAHPLRLADGQIGAFGPESVKYELRVRRVNLTASPIAGIGGLGVVVLVVLMTVVAPQAWWIVAASVAGGVLLGFAMVIISRRRVAAGPRAGGANVLLGDRASDSRRS
jgi:hypothetical protein